MDKEIKKKRVQVLADIIQNLLQQVDLFTQGLSKEDFEILDEVRESLETQISYKQSASPLFYAIGADPDTTEAEMKLKTVNALIELIKTRIEYKEKLIKKQEENKNRQNVINMFRNAGML